MSGAINSFADVIDEDEDILTANQATGFLREMADYFIRNQEPMVENVGERLIKSERRIEMTYKVFCIGGDPGKIAFLANALREKIDDLQNDGWEIDGVDLINNTRAWDSGKQMYVETPEYIIRAKKENK